MIPRGYRGVIDGPFAVDTAGQERPVPGTSGRVTVENVGANPVRIFLTKADFDGNKNFIERAAGSVWSEPLEVRERIWWKAVSAPTSVSVLYCLLT